MGREIEVKHLVAHDGWRSSAERPMRLAQGYVAVADRTSVRVRVAGDRAWLTVKVGAGMSRGEYEYAIPVEDAQELLAHAVGTVIDKTRWHVRHDGAEWTVDEFEGALSGLLLAELELDSEDSRYAVPDWAGEDVTGRPEYLNSSLSIRGLPT